MMTAKQIGNIIVAKTDLMTTTGPQCLALVKDLFGRVDIATMRAGVELAAAEFEILSEDLDEPAYLVAAIVFRDCFMECCALRVVCCGTPATRRCHDAAHPRGSWRVWE